MRVIPEVKRVIHDSVVLEIIPIYASFFQAERQRSNWHSIGARVATAAARLFPHTMQFTVARSYQRKGLEALGTGYHSVVATGSDSASKIHHRT